MSTQEAKEITGPTGNGTDLLYAYKQICLTCQPYRIETVWEIQVLQ
jgi:hypothetical protein